MNSPFGTVLAVFGGLTIVSYFLYDNFYCYQSDYSNVTIVSNSDPASTKGSDFYTGPEIDSYSECIIDGHNNITTHQLPHMEILERWRTYNVSRLDQFDMGLHIINAYTYPNFISITLTTRNHYRQTVFCRYYDCHKREISPPYETVIYPESNVMCVRKRGADYISITFEVDEEAQEPVKLVDRTKGYEHEFAVCLAPFHGTEKKWIAIIELIEYYKLMGATMFYLYVVEIDDYTDLVLKDYLRTNDIEVTYLRDRFWSLPFAWHMVSINECTQRSRFHAKWTAFHDLDERVAMNATSKYSRVVDYLRDVIDPNVVSLEFRVQWIKKTAKFPERFVNDSQLESEMIFRKFHSTGSNLTRHGFQQKCIVRTDKIGGMFVHYVWHALMFPGMKVVLVDPEIGYLKHYRQLEDSFMKNFHIGNIVQTGIDPDLEKPLTDAILKRAKFVYDQQPAPNCTVQQQLYKYFLRHAPCYLEELERNKTMLQN